MEVSVAGDVNPDLLYLVDSFPEVDSQEIARSFTLKLGGSAANTAYALAKLGAKVHFYGAVGRDMLGDFCESELKSAGVHTHMVKVDAPTGTTSAVEWEGTRTMFTYRGANEFLDRYHITPRGSWLHISGYWHLERLRPHIGELLRSAKDRGLVTSFDVGSWSKDWGEAKYILNAIRKGYLDYLFVNEREIVELTGRELETAVEMLRKYTTIGLHMGRKGAKIIGKDFVVYTPAVEGITVRYTTGAGDTWNAGFIWGFLRTGDIRKAAEIAMVIVEGYVEKGVVLTPSEL